MFPIDFLVTFSKVKVKLLVFIVHVVYSISYDPLMVTKLATHFLTIEIALWVTRSRSNY